MLSIVAAIVLTNAPTLSAYDLRCEYLRDPIGVDAKPPRLSWKVKSLNPSARGQKQAGYEIIVADSIEALKEGRTTYWHSGPIKSEQTSFIDYKGKPVPAGATVFWKVRLQNSEGKEGAWSKPASWTAAPEWNADWISFPSKHIDDKIPVPNNGFHGAIEDGSKTDQWVQIDLGEPKSFTEIRLWPARPYDFADTPGFLFPVQFGIETSDDSTFENKRTLLKQMQIPNPGTRKVVLPCSGKARFVRLHVTRLAQRDEKAWSYALAEMEVIDQGKNIALGCAVEANRQTRTDSWSMSKLTDGDLVSHGSYPLDPLPATHLRKEFAAHGKVKKVILFASALGVYEARINGQRVGDHILAPEWTDYRVRVQYQGYDVTKLVKDGANCIGAILGDGWYSGRIAWYPRGYTGRIPTFKAQLQLEYSDGNKETICTDKTWQSTDQGPIVSSDLLDGENYAARKELAGWDAVGFNTAGWKAVRLANNQAPKIINSQPNEPIKQVVELKPISTTNLSNGSTIIDLGQNMVGWARLKLAGKKDKTVTIRYGEMLNDDGSVYYANLRGAPQIDKYTFAKDGSATFEPHFTYHGFQYIEIQGATKPVSKEDVKGIVFCSSSPVVSKFECSDKMVNQLWSNILWTQRANLMSSPTDCPQRDERLGWMGDIQAFSQTAAYNMDMSGFFAKWFQDIRDAQSDEGLYPEFVPFPPKKGDGVGSPAWSDAGVMVPWAAFLNYGDTRMLIEHFASACKYVDFLHRENPNGLWLNKRGNDFNDWLNGDTIVKDGYPMSGGSVSPEVLGTAFMARSTQIVGDMAFILGLKNESSKYRTLAEKSRAAFCKAYVDDEGKIKGDTQAGYALALDFDLLPDQLRKKAAAHMADALKPYGGHLSTGIQTTHHLMLQLSRLGYNDLAYQLLLKRTFPSWGYSIDNGATTIWERWDGWVKGRGFQHPGMNSFNHWALGSVGEWIAKTVGGISPGYSGGWQVPDIHPQPASGISWSKFTYDSIKGPIMCAWSLKNGRFEMSVEVPIGMWVHVYVLAKSADEVFEGKTLASKAEGVHFLRMEDGCAVYKVESGKYSFQRR